MNGLLISMISLVVVMMGVTFVLVTTIVGKITENSRNVKRREDYIVGKKKEEKKNRSPFLERRMSTRAAFVFKSGCKGKNFKA